MLDSIISFFTNVVAGNLFAVLRNVNAELVVKKYGGIVLSTFAVLDPIVSNLISTYDESTVQRALQLIVARVGDKELSDVDVLLISKFILEQFDFSIAAAAKLDPATEEGKISLEIMSKAGELSDGVSFDELLELVRLLPALA